MVVVVIFVELVTWRRVTWRLRRPGSSGAGVGAPLRRSAGGPAPASALVVRTWRTARAVAVAVENAWLRW